MTMESTVLWVVTPCCWRVSQETNRRSVKLREPCIEKHILYSLSISQRENLSYIYHIYRIISPLIYRDPKQHSIISISIRNSEKLFSKKIQFIKISREITFPFNFDCSIPQKVNFPVAIWFYSARKVYCSVAIWLFSAQKVNFSGKMQPNDDRKVDFPGRKQLYCDRTKDFLAK